MIYFTIGLAFVFSVVQSLLMNYLSNIIKQATTIKECQLAKLINLLLIARIWLFVILLISLIVTNIIEGFSWLASVISGGVAILFSVLMIFLYRKMIETIKAEKKKKHFLVISILQGFSFAFLINVILTVFHI